MLPTTQEIARQLAVMVELFPDMTISEIASELGFSPIFIINAIAEGERMELIKRTANYNDDKLELITALDLENNGGFLFGEENSRLQREITQLLNDLAEKEEDIEHNQLAAWLRGVRPSGIEISLHVLKQLDIIDSYQLADPKDPKSKYTFYTLMRNSKFRWGKKQFSAGKK